MTSRDDVARILRWSVFSLWMPSVALAAGVTLDETLRSITLLVVAVVFMLSTLAGLTALVVRLNDQLIKFPDQPMPKAALFVAMNLLGAWLAGGVALFLAEAGDINDWLELTMITLSSFTGARYLELLAEKLVLSPLRAHHINITHPASSIEVEEAQH